MAEFAELPCPVMRAPTRFDPDQARRPLCEELQHLRTRQGLAPLYHSVLIHAVNLKNLLRNVQPATSKLHRDSPCSVIERPRSLQSGTTDAVRAGGVHVMTLKRSLRGSEVIVSELHRHSAPKPSAR